MPGARDLHDSSREAVRERLAYWQRRGRAEGRERAAVKVAARVPGPVGAAARVARAVRPDVGKLVRNPAQHAREKPAATALLLFTVLVTIAVLRRGAFPSGRGVFAVAGVGFAFMALAAFPPTSDLTLLLLVVALIVSAIESAGTIGTVVDLGTARFQSALGGAA